MDRKPYFVARKQFLKLLWFWAWIFFAYCCLTSIADGAATPSILLKQEEYLRRVRHQKGTMDRYKRYFFSQEHRRYFGSRSTEKNPIFDTSVRSSVSVPLDEPAYLHCIVKNQGTYEVTWLRKKDGHVLTVGKDTFTNDERFQMSFKEGNNPMEKDWCLLIKYARKQDSGVYECQLSTEPAQSLLVTLNVTANNAEMSGTDQVQDGDSIRLSCKVQLKDEHSKEPNYIIWSLNNSFIDVSKDRNRYRTSRSKRGDLLVHTLEVHQVTVNDTGKYTCKAASAPEQSMLIQVNVDGNLPEMGQIFTNHMIIMEWNREKGWDKPEITELKPLQIHPAAKCLHYAIQPVDTKELTKCIENFVKLENEWIPREPGGILYVRLGMIGTEPTLLPKYSKTAMFYGICTPGTLVVGKMAEGATLYVNPSIYRTSPGVGEAKMGCNYAASVVQLKHAVDLGCQEVLFIYGKEQLVTECCGRNVFMVWINETGELEVTTPSLEAALVLNGVTRRSVIEILKEEATVKVTERNLYFPDLKKALDEGRLLEMFITGTATGVVPVKCLRDQP